jgi:hypothetical protein
MGVVSVAAHRIVSHSTIGLVCGKLLTVMVCV